MPTSSDLVTDLPADFEVFGQAVDTSLADLKGGTTGQVLKKNSNTDMDFVWGADSAGMTNPMTTTGDTIYSSSGSTPARLGIGSTGQVLTVSGGLPAWATPAGGATNFQLINSGGTALTGASTITVSGISGKNQLAIYIVDCSSASGAATFILRINSDSGSNYYFARFSAEATTFDLGGGNDASFPLGSQGSTAANAMTICEIKIDGCNAAGIKTFASQSRCNGTSLRSYIVRGHYSGSSTISSISLISESGNFDAGTIYVYGA